MEKVSDGHRSTSARDRASLVWLLGSAALLVGGGAVLWLVARSAAHLPPSPLSFAWPVWMEQRLLTGQAWFILGSSTALVLALARAVRLLVTGRVVASTAALRIFSGLCYRAAFIDFIPLPVAAIDLGLTPSSETALIAQLSTIMGVAVVGATLHGLVGLGGVRALSDRKQL